MSDRRSSTQSRQGGRSWRRIIQPTKLIPHIQYTVKNAALESNEVTGTLRGRGVASSASAALDRTPYPVFPPIAGELPEAGVRG